MVVRIPNVAGELFVVARVDAVKDLTALKAQLLAGRELFTLVVRARLSTEVVGSIAAIQNAVVLRTSEVVVGTGKIGKLNPANVEFNAWLHIVGAGALVDSGLLRAVKFVNDFATSEPLLVPIPELSAGLGIVDAVLVPFDIAVTDVLTGVVSLGALTIIQKCGGGAVDSVLLVVFASFGLKGHEPREAVLFNARNHHGT
jgi:hypothetical protein